MKLIMAIINKEDSDAVITALSRSGYHVTRLASTGGFLRSGNSTILVGTEDQNVDVVCGIIQSRCKSRKQMHTLTPFDSGFSTAQQIEVTTGGATVLVLNVEKYVKIV